MRAVDVVVRPGEVIGYLGPNGSGKTTTVRMITGLTEPSEGTVLHDGRSIFGDLVAFRRRLGYVPEEAHLYPFLSGREYLELVGRLRELPVALLERKINSLLELFGILSAADQPISGYSKGMKQKVLISAALLHDPDLLILDEPESGLDVTAVLVLRSLITELARRGKAILYSSHIMESVERVCSRVMVLHRGEVVADDSSSQAAHADVARLARGRVRRSWSCRTIPTAPRRTSPTWPRCAPEAAPMSSEPRRLLTAHFLRRLIDDDLISPNADRHESLSMICAMLVSLGPVRLGDHLDAVPVQPVPDAGHGVGVGALRSLPVHVRGDDRHRARDAARVGRPGGGRARRVGARRHADPDPHHRGRQVQRPRPLRGDVRGGAQPGAERHRAGADGVEAAAVVAGSWSALILAQALVVTLASAFGFFAVLAIRGVLQALLGRDAVHARRAGRAGRAARERRVGVPAAAGGGLARQPRRGSSRSRARR